MASTLSFWAKEDQLVTLPEYRPVAGMPPEYVGRAFAQDPVTGKWGHPATSEPFTCAAESPVGRRLVLLTRRDACLIPADEATARACGVAFKAHELLDGVMVPVSPKKPS